MVKEMKKDWGWTPLSSPYTGTNGKQEQWVVSVIKHGSAQVPVRNTAAIVCLFPSEIGWSQNVVGHWPTGLRACTSALCSPGTSLGPRTTPGEQIWNQTPGRALVHIILQGNQSLLGTICSNLLGLLGAHKILLGFVEPTLSCSYKQALAHGLQALSLQLVTQLKVTFVKPWLSRARNYFANRDWVSVVLLSNSSFSVTGFWWALSCCGKSPAST